jgi:hypothetical protein
MTLAVRWAGGAKKHAGKGQPKGATGMRARGPSIVVRQPITREPHLRPWPIAAAILAFFLVNLVAIAAFLATAARAAAEPARIATAAVPVLVTPGEVRSGALLLKSENDRP